MPKIAVNAGHCPGLDSGACGSYSQEADIVKKVAEIVCSDLNNVGYETLFIQENELEDICSMSDSFGADLFVSIRCNSAENSSAKGTETFYCEGSSNGYRLASKIQSQLLNTLGTIDRGLKTNRLYVTSNTVAPAALVELGFISNQDEEFMLNTRIEDMAHAIARGISDYYV